MSYKIAGITLFLTSVKISEVNHYLLPRNTNPRIQNQHFHLSKETPDYWFHHWNQSWMIERSLRWFHTSVNCYLRVNSMHLIKKRKSWCRNIFKVSGGYFVLILLLSNSNHGGEKACTNHCTYTTTRDESHMSWVFPLKFFCTGSSSEGPDVIDVAYRVQGLRLGESPQPKNLIGGSMQGKN